MIIAGDGMERDLDHVRDQHSRLGGVLDCRIAPDSPARGASYPQRRDRWVRGRRHRACSLRASVLDRADGPRALHSALL